MVRADLVKPQRPLHMIVAHALWSSTRLCTGSNHGGHFTLLFRTSSIHEYDGVTLKRRAAYTFSQAQPEGTAGQKDSSATRIEIKIDIPLLTHGKQSSSGWQARKERQRLDVLVLTASHERRRCHEVRARIHRLPRTRHCQHGQLNRTKHFVLAKH